MTTNVFCQASKVLATDSRWSYEIPGYCVIYVDDAPFEKIAVSRPKGVAFMFAGDSALINEWKQWVWFPVAKRPGVNAAISICMVDLSNSEVAFNHNLTIDHPSIGALFAGTGAWPAYGCWKNNKNPMKAVESAKLADRYSGGTVRFFDLSTGENNLQLTDDFQSIRVGTLERGQVMYFQNPAHVPVKDAVNDDPKVAELAERIKSGQCSMTAPSASAENRWSAEDEARLDEALKKYFPEVR